MFSGEPWLGYHSTWRLGACGGPNPDRPGLVAIGTVIAPVPVPGLAANFSPIPRMAPPPLGSEIVGADTWDVSCVVLCCSPSRLWPLIMGLPPDLPFSPFFIPHAHNRLFDP